MPEDNNTNGPGRNNGGPWGQAPGGGGGGPRRPAGGGNNNTPNLEDLLSRGRSQFQGGIPGGRWGLLGIGAALVVLWLSQSFYTIDPQEIGVDLRFGKPKEVLSEPGLHFHLWPIDQIERVNITENKTSIGSVSGARVAEGHMLSGDQNIVDVAFTVLWRVGDPAAYLFNVSEPNVMVQRAAESAMREVVGRRPAQDIFRDDKAGIAIEVEEITQAILDSYGVGVSIAQIAIEDVAPPTEVADAFDEVQRAEQDEDRFQEEARQYANTRLGGARGDAAQMRESAAAYKNSVVQEAEGESARFSLVYNQYVLAPDVTRKRLFLETMEQVLGNSEKVILSTGANGSGVVPYLPLPELRSRSAGGQ